MMTTLMEKSDAPDLLLRLPWTWQILRKLLVLVESVEFFLHFCAALFTRALSPQCREALTLTEDEAFRIRRALLRFQLYAQIFHQPEATDMVISDRDWECRAESQQYFFTRFECVEAEEIKCIYSSIYHALSHLEPRWPLSCSNETQGSTNDSPPGAAYKSQLRGLPLLQEVFSRKPSQLAASYAACLVAYAFHGFEEVDPDDGNWFVKYSNSDIAERLEVHKCRWQPTLWSQEWNFGVEALERPKKARDIKELCSLKKRRDRTAWRLMGYCFWDQEHVESISQDLGLSKER